VSVTFAVGYVSRAIGLQGELAVRCFDPKSTVLLEVERVSLQPATAGQVKGAQTEFELLQCRMAGQKEFAMACKSISTREAAEGFAGATVFVFRDDLDPPESGSYFIGDLVGLTAVDGNGETIGKVESVLDVGPVCNLVLRVNNEEVMVPFADEFIQRVDLQAASVVVRLPEYA
jgi:16S rRNA processing protein RimM